MLMLIALLWYWHAMPITEIVLIAYLPPKQLYSLSLFCYNAYNSQQFLPDVMDGNISTFGTYSDGVQPFNFHFAFQTVATANKAFDTD